MFTTFVQFLFKLRFPEGQGGMKETFGNSGGEGGFIFLHKNGNSGEVGGLSWNSLRGGGMDIFWNCTLFHTLFFKEFLLDGGISFVGYSAIGPKSQLVGDRPVGHSQSIYCT